MALSITTLCLVLSCLTLASRSNGMKKENQYCGDEKFYCPTESQCFNREFRCTASKVCLDFNGNEAKCFESNTPGMYVYYKKTTPLPSSGSSSKRKRSVWDTARHWFVEYRGFVYEFGTYGFQELDINDPNYKYGPGREKVSSEEYTGSSRCTRQQVLTFVGKWLHANPEYRLFKNNCQHFAKRLLEELEMNCPNRIRRQDDNTESLKAPSECYTSSSIRWKVHSMFASLILFVILHNVN
ncbi:uncharacterized protein LOC144634478 [Oculina patagonica]